MGRRWVMLDKRLQIGPLDTKLPKKYRRTSESYRRVIRYISEYQQDAGIAPSSYRQIGRETGISHSQVIRLMIRAEQQGLLRRKTPDALSFDTVISPPNSNGLVWVPHAECLWNKQIKWSEDDSRGFWLDRGLFGINETRNLWALSFPEPPNTGQRAPLRLDEFAVALVRRCNVDSLGKNFEGYNFVVEVEGTVSVYEFLKLLDRDILFRQPSPDREKVYVPLGSIRSISQVLMTTIRPAMPKPK